MIKNNLVKSFVGSDFNKLLKLYTEWLIELDKSKTEIISVTASKDISKFNAYEIRVVYSTTIFF